MKPFRTTAKKVILYSTADLPVLCTCAEAGRLLRCSPEAVARMARDGRLKGVKQGTSWLFRRDDLVAYVDRLFDADQGR